MTQMKKLAALLICFIIALSSGCAHKLNRYQAEFISLFDTVTVIVGYSESREDFTLLAEKIKNRLEEYHILYDIYNDYEGINNIKTINDHAGTAPVQVDERIIGLLEFALEQFEATGGAVNAAMGSVLSIWHEYRTQGINDPAHAQLPPPEILREAARHIDISNIELDKEASTVYLNDPDMRLDVGALAKGYAVEQIASWLESEGVTNLLLSVGGNVRAIGGKPDGKYTNVPWVVSIRNPDKSASDSDLMSVQMADSSLVSSGGYERYYTVDGARYHHIINPDTLMPSDYYQAVSVICPDSGMADILSTAIYNMPPDESMKYVESTSDTEAIFIYEDGRFEYTSGFESLIYNNK